MASKNVLFEAVALLLIANLCIIAAQTCKINIKTGMDAAHPPLIVSSDDHVKYLYAPVNDPGNLVFEKGQPLTVFCPGSTNLQNVKQTKPGSVIINSKQLNSTEDIECDGNNKFKTEDLTGAFTFKDITCDDKRGAGPLLKDINKPCINGERYEIGYDLGDRGFLRTIDLCHNKTVARTLWAHDSVVPVNQDKFRFHTARKAFKAGSLYEGMGMSKDGPYKLESAYETVKELLDNSESVDKYLSKSTSDNKYFAKGHLIANADKLYKSEQDSTYFYANTVPMWSKVNGKPGNWFFVEEYVRHLAFHKNRELDIWVGGIGTLTLEDKEIYLYNKNETDGEVIRKIPVPKVIFKCVVDKKEKESLCFLVVNNPYLTKQQVEENEEEYVVCPKYNLCDKVNEHHDKGDRGYSYCCKLDDFYESQSQELGLEDVKSYLEYEPLALLTKDKNPTAVTE